MLNTTELRTAIDALDFKALDANRYRDEVNALVSGR